MDARSSTQRFLDAETLSKLSNLQLRVRAVVDGTMAGLHRRPHHGSSIEFAEHKHYAPGDDLRRLDWKAYAKFDRYYIRQYEDETELKAYMLLDCSGSMGYGAPMTKLEYGSVLVASLSYLLAWQRDHPSLLAFAEGIRRFVPPRSRSGHTVEVLRALETLEAEGTTNLESAVNRMIEIGGRRRLVIVVSDLLDVSDVSLRLLRHLRARNHQVVLFHVLHDDELELPFSRLTMFEAMEGPGRVLVDPGAIRRAYGREIARFLAHVETICQESEIGYRLVSTSHPLDAVLLPLLRRRGGGR